LRRREGPVPCTRSTTRRYGCDVGSCTNCQSQCPPLRQPPRVNQTRYGEVEVFRVWYTIEPDRATEIVARPQMPLLRSARGRGARVRPLAHEFRETQMDFETIHFEINDAAASLILSRPARSNALNARMLE